MLPKKFLHPTCWGPIVAAGCMAVVGGQTKLCEAHFALQYCGVGLFRHKMMKCEHRLPIAQFTDSIIVVFENLRWQQHVHAFHYHYGSGYFQAVLKFEYGCAQAPIRVESRSF
eukprot:SAG31_NODE_4953_length_2837_cov_1.979547_4_plen_113_part_00